VQFGRHELVLPCQWSNVENKPRRWWCPKAEGREGRKRGVRRIENNYGRLVGMLASQWSGTIGLQFSVDAIWAYSNPSQTYINVQYLLKVSTRNNKLRKRNSLKGRGAYTGLRLWRWWSGRWVGWILWHMWENAWNTRSRTEVRDTLGQCRLKSGQMWRYARTNEV
jgi:hypothetical protein